MIRARLDRDLAPLVAALEELSWPPGASSGEQRRAWLLQPAARRSWVFDSAPVTVTPTGNVVGHVQIAAPGESGESLVASTGAVRADLLVIGRLFVRPLPHAEGIRRFLLTEAVRSVRAEGRIAVLDVAANPGLSENLCQRRGFRHVPSAGSGSTLMVHDEEVGGQPR